MDMDKLNNYYSNLEDKLHHSPSGADETIVHIFEHRFLQWDPKTQCYLTEVSSAAYTNDLATAAQITIIT